MVERDELRHDMRHVDIHVTLFCYNAMTRR